MEKTLENFRKLQKVLGRDYSFDYIDSHFDILIRLIDTRKKYNKFFNEKIWFNKTDNQIWVFSFIGHYDNDIIIQTSTFGKYRGRNDCSETPNVTLDKVLTLIDSNTLIPLNIEYGEFESVWKGLTSDYYRKIEAFEIKTHNELIDQLFNKFKL
jgi:hypothetical protein